MNPIQLFMTITDIDLSLYKKETEIIIQGKNNQNTQICFANIYYEWN